MAIDKQTQKLLITTGVGIAVFFVAKKQILDLLSSIGLTKKPEQIAASNASTTNNAFNPNYWKTVNNGGAQLTVAVAEGYIKTIWDSIGFWNKDYANILGVFKQLQTKAQVSYLSWKFFQIHNIDLYEFLKGGNNYWNVNSLNDGELVQLNNYVNSLINA
jgi:hypothetical protein